MDKEKLVEKLEKQDKFILDFFNDKRINADVKSEWLKKYNLLNIKISNE